MLETATGDNVEIFTASHGDSGADEQQFPRVSDAHGPDVPAIQRRQPGEFPVLIAADYQEWLALGRSILCPPVTRPLPPQEEDLLITIVEKFVPLEPQGVDGARGIEDRDVQGP